MMLHRGKEHKISNRADHWLLTVCTLCAFAFGHIITIDDHICVSCVRGLVTSSLRRVNDIDCGNWRRLDNERNVDGVGNRI